MEYLGVQALEEKTKVYEDAPSIASPISWPRFGEVRLEAYHPGPADYGFVYELVESAEGMTPDYSNGLAYYVGCAEGDGSPFVRLSDLPTEFFNHQLFGEGAEFEEYVQAFMTKWGLLFSPLRNSWGCLDGWGFLEAMSMQGVKETDILIERMPELAGQIVSKQEAEMTMLVLREIVLFLRKYIKSGGEDVQSLALLSAPLSVASCNSYQIGPFSSMRQDFAQGVTISLHDMGLLTSAICNQLITAIVDEDVPWRECRCRDCDTLFKYAQTGAMTPNQDAYYCCKRHSDRERQRLRRERGKAKKTE